MKLDIITAATDQNLFGPYLGDPATWSRWFAVLRVMFGLPLRPADRQIVRRATKRSLRRLPADGFKRSLLLCGRRSGKSKISALVAAFLAGMSGLEGQLSPGERGFVACVAPTREQAEIVRQYVRGAFATPMLAAEVADDNRGELTLRNGVTIKVFAGSFRTARGFTLLGAVVDEVCFFRHSEECEVNAQELVRALRPALTTIQGSKLIAIGSKYSMDGWAYETWKAQFGSDKGATLVWDATSTEMNLTIDKAEIAAAVAEDPESARSEFFNEWRDDVAAFLPRSLVESLVVRERQELLPRPAINYAAFVDMSGGRSDDASAAIAHKDGAKITLDKLLRFRPPFDPYAVISNIARTFKEYGIRRAFGDRYSAEFTTRAFRSAGIAYLPSDKSKAELYLESLGPLCGGTVELLDYPALVDQFSQLERKVRAGGKDQVDHPRGGHDDLSNAAAGAIYLAGRPQLRVGAFFRDKPADGVAMGRAQLAAMVSGGSQAFSRSAI